MKIIMVLFLFFTTFLQAQVHQDLRTIIKTEEKLSDAFKQLYQMEDSPKRDSLNSYIIDNLSESLKTWDGYYYPWNSLEFIGRISSKDQKVKIFTWHLTDKSGKQKYFGLIAQREGKKNKRKEKLDFKVIHLNDKSESMRNPQTPTLSADNWYGSVYYRISTFIHRKQTWYVLYGYDLNDSFSNRKSLEIMTIDKKGDVEFDGTIHIKDKVVKRLIFEYSSEVVMSVNYDEKLNMIVWDHLSPLEPLFRGNYRFYSPDGSYDGLRFEKGEFYLVEDVDARNN